MVEQRDEDRFERSGLDPVATQCSALAEVAPTMTIRCRGHEGCKSSRSTHRCRRIGDHDAWTQAHPFVGLPLGRCIPGFNMQCGEADS